MRGNPLLRLALVLVLFLIALVPMWKLTAARDPAPAIDPAPSAPATVPTQVEITSMPSTEKFSVRHLDQIIWKGSGSKSTQTLSLPRNGFDLQIHATWPIRDDSEKALRVRVTRDDLPLADTTFWGVDQIDEVLSVPAN